eukprot:GHVQ01001152.1.p1 GENE.GHVQ01001152.1~~GHVQ01001152.1.p1  ORF type:complete len:684 (+),score=87.73 GHVQ01001152.1:238-2289(+)
MRGTTNKSILSARTYTRDMLRWPMELHREHAFRLWTGAALLVLVCSSLCLLTDSHTEEETAADNFADTVGRAGRVLMMEDDETAVATIGGTIGLSTSSLPPVEGLDAVATCVQLAHNTIPHTSEPASSSTVSKLITVDTRYRDTCTQLYAGCSGSAEKAEVLQPFRHCWLKEMCHWLTQRGRRFDVRTLLELVAVLQPCVERCVEVIATGRENGWLTEKEWQRIMSGNTKVVSSYIEAAFQQTEVPATKLKALVTVLSVFAAQQLCSVHSQDDGGELCDVHSQAAVACRATENQTGVDLSGLFMFTSLQFGAYGHFCLAHAASILLALKDRTSYSCAEAIFQAQQELTMFMTLLSIPLPSQQEKHKQLPIIQMQFIHRLNSYFLFGPMKEDTIHTEYEGLRNNPLLSYLFGCSKRRKSLGIGDDSFTFRKAIALMHLWTLLSHRDTRSMMYPENKFSDNGTAQNERPVMAVFLEEDNPVIVILRLMSQRMKDRTAQGLMDKRLATYVHHRKVDPQYLQSQVVQEVQNVYLSELALLATLHEEGTAADSTSAPSSTSSCSDALAKAVVKLVDEIMSSGQQQNREMLTMFESDDMQHRFSSIGLRGRKLDLIMVFTKALKWALLQLTEQIRDEDFTRWRRAVRFVLALAAYITPVDPDKGWRMLFPETDCSNYVYLIKLAVWVCK